MAKKRGTTKSMPGEIRKLRALLVLASFLPALFGGLLLFGTIADRYEIWPQSTFYILIGLSVAMIVLGHHRYWCRYPAYPEMAFRKDFDLGSRRGLAYFWNPPGIPFDHQPDREQKCEPGLTLHYPVAARSLNRRQLHQIIVVAGVGSISRQG